VPWIAAQNRVKLTSLPYALIFSLIKRNENNAEVL